MDFEDYQTAVLDDISTTSSDAFFTTVIVKRAINRAYKWVAGLRNWPQTEEAYVRDTTLGDSYYNYPSNFKTDSITRLVYDGEEYEKTVWRDYLRYQDEHPNYGGDKLFADYKRQYHINASVEALTDGVEVWGQAIPDDLVNNADLTKFNGDSNLEEAILKKALSILYKKARGQMYDRGVSLEDEAKALISDAWTQIMKAQGDYQSKDTEVFKRIEILPTRGQRRQSGRGNFNTII